MKAAICCFTLALVIACESVNISGNSFSIAVDEGIEKEKAHVYRHKTTIYSIYCEKKSDVVPRGFDYIGTHDVDASKIALCHFQ